MNPWARTIPALLLPAAFQAQSSAPVAAPDRLPLYLLIGALVVLLALFVFRELANRTLIEAKKTRIIELEELCRSESGEKNRLLGENKQLGSLSADLRAKHQSVQELLASAQNQITRFEAGREEQTRDHLRMVRDLENSRKALQDEQARVIRLEEEKRLREEEERDRMWAVHEQESIARMREVCQKQSLGFPFYDANNLPEGFDAALKPDFMVDFLGQFIIFDAKVSKSTNLASYIKSQVKSSSTKYKNSASSEAIYKTAFFVVPTVELKNLKEVSYFEQGYTFYIIPIEAFEPILGAYRRVADYDLVDRFDPQERENIVNLIALLSQQIRHQNAINVLATLAGVKILQEVESLPDNVAAAVEERLKSMRIPGLNQSEIKRLINSPEEQLRELARLATPTRPPISPQDLKEAHETGLEE
jgi:hypothetical protein